MIKSARCTRPALLGIAAVWASTGWSDEATVLRKLAEAAPHLTVAGISESPVAGIHEVEIQEDRSRLYATADGNHLFAGDVYAVTPEGLANLTEARREVQRRKALDFIDLSDMVVFAPSDGIRAFVYVFTDVECFYCRKLHQDMMELNDRGIEVRYIAYPRGGPGTPAYDKMVSVWCSTNRQEAMTTVKLGESIDKRTCDNPVAEQFALGISFHIGGTPAMFTEHGEQISGYVPPDQLSRRLGLP